MSAQNRTPPAYQEYAAAMMSRIEYRTLTLPQRGLLYSMRLECWVNQLLPESPSVLARILGFDASEVAAELPYVMQFFACENGRIFAPDLEAYREHLDERHKRQSDAAKATNEKRWGRKPRAVAGDSTDIGKRVGRRNDGRVGERIAFGSLLSTVQPSLAQPRNGGVTEYGDTEVVGREWSDFTDFTHDPEGGDE